MMKKASAELFNFMVIAPFFIIFFALILYVVFFFQDNSIDSNLQRMQEQSDHPIYTLVALNYLRAPITVEETAMTIGDYIAQATAEDNLYPKKLKEITKELFVDQELCFKLFLSEDESSEALFHCVGDYALNPTTGQISNVQKKVARVNTQLPQPNGGTQPLHFVFY